MFKKIIFKKSFIFLLLIFLIFTTFFLFNSKNEIILAGENFGGWAYDNFFGWTSESCNNLYEDDYQDYCGIEIEPILDINFDSGEIDMPNKVIDSVGNFHGMLFNFMDSDIRNGGKDKITGEAERNSNFNNSLYFNGVNSYINFGAHSELSFSEKDFTISLWFRPVAGFSSDHFLFSNGTDLNKRYHCWVDSSYLVNCNINGINIESDQSLEVDKWHSLTLVREGEKILMYVDGQEKELIIGEVSPLTEEDLILGANGGHSFVFNGELDEFRFFDQVLSVDQVLHNIKHNANYLLNIEEGTGLMNGWIWSNGIGWICIGDTCNGLTPISTNPTAKLYWSHQGGDKYPHMIEGWANAVAFNDAGQPDYQDIGWISFQSPDLVEANYDKYGNCVSCVFKDEEDDLVLYLKMDEDAGFWAMDSSGFNNNASLRNFEESTWINDGRINNCLFFDGIDDYLDININADKGLQIGFSDFTVEAWIKNEKEEGGAVDLLPIISAKSSEEWNMFFNSEDTILFNIFGSSLEGKGSNFDEWSQILVTVDRDSKMKLYINGELKNEIDIAEFSNIEIKNNAIFIGADNNGRFWNDKLDIIRLYKKVLSQEEIVYNYKSPEKKSCSACLSQTLDSSSTDNICYNCQRCREDSGINNCRECSSCREYGLVLDSNTSSIRGYAWGGNLVNGETAGMGWFKFSPSTGLYRSYVSSKYGNVYSKENVGSDYTVAPPTKYFNATYIIQANGHIINWNSEMDWYMSADNNIPLYYKYPKIENNYTNVLGNLDYSGLTTGLYGSVLDELPNEGMSNFNVCLDGGIYMKDSDYILEEKSSGVSYNFENCDQAAGTIIIDGDLTIEGDVRYDNDLFSGSSEKLASVAWIIKGDLKINSEVEKLAGTFIVLGKDGVECGYDQENPNSHCGSIFTCDGEESKCGKKLEVSGQFLAKNFVFGRTYRSLMGSGRDPAEHIIYDGRNIINPPPGLGDVLKTLPNWNQVAPY